MRILLTGHRGFIGSHMLTALAKHQVYTYEWGESLPCVKGMDWVIHIGANSSTTETNIDLIMRQNYDFSCWLLDECSRFDVNLQYSSSASIYGLGKNFRETAAPDPRTAYAWSKYLFERQTQKLHYAHIIVQGFRYFNVYGSGEEHKGDQASPYTKFGIQAKRDGRIQIFEGSERYLRDFVPVEQVVDTHLRFLDIPESGVWNVGTGHAQSFFEVARQFAVPIVEIPMPEKLRNGYQAYTCADNQHISATFKKHDVKSPYYG